MSKERDLPSLDEVRVRVKEMLEDNCTLPDYCFISGDDVIVALRAYDSLAAELEEQKLFNHPEMSDLKLQEKYDALMDESTRLRFELGLSKSLCQEVLKDNWMLKNESIRLHEKLNVCSAENSIKIAIIAEREVRLKDTNAELVEALEKITVIGKPKFGLSHFWSDLEDCLIVAHQALIKFKIK